MKKNVVVFTISSDLVFAVANLMMDIKKFSSQIADEVIVLHDGINKRDAELLNTILPTKAIRYEIPVDDLSKFNQRTLKYFTIMAFAKYECLKLLTEYKNVTYIDPDMVILKDISDLTSYCQSGIKMMPSGSKVYVQLHENIAEYDMDAEAICACLFVFQDHLVNYEKMYESCITNLNKYASKLKFAEQAIFDFMIQEFSIQICPIDKDEYSPHPNDTNLYHKAKVLHAYGQPKFWNGLKNEQWNKNYKKWIEMGGSKYKTSSVFKKAFLKIKNTIGGKNNV